MNRFCYFTFSLSSFYSEHNPKVLCISMPIFALLNLIKVTDFVLDLKSKHRFLCRNPIRQTANGELSVVAFSTSRYHPFKFNPLHFLNAIYDFPLSYRISFPFNFRGESVDYLINQCRLSSSSRVVLILTARPGWACSNL